MHSYTGWNATFDRIGKKLTKSSTLPASVTDPGTSSHDAGDCDYLFDDHDPSYSDSLACGTDTCYLHAYVYNISSTYILTFYTSFIVAFLKDKLL